MKEKYEIFADEPLKSQQERRDRIYAEWIEELKALDPEEELVVSIVYGEHEKNMKAKDFIERLQKMDRAEEYSSWRKFRLYNA